jgi:hypothetical protein
MPCTASPPLLLLEPPAGTPAPAVGVTGARPNEPAERKLPVKLGGGNRDASCAVQAPATTCSVGRRRSSPEGSQYST